LQLQADEHQVVGWVSGTRDFAGRTVTVTINRKVKELIVSKENTFTWPYKVSKPATAEFVLADGKTRLQASLMVGPPSAPPGPCVFFVVDRTAYRPGQVLHFAGFLRKQDSSGEFVPLGKQKVDVDLTSQRKATKAAALK